MSDANTNAAVRYQVRALELSIAFRTEQLGLKVDRHTSPFAQISRGSLALILSGPETSGARDMPDGRKQEPGGWDRIIDPDGNPVELHEAPKPWAARSGAWWLPGPARKTAESRDQVPEPLTRLMVRDCARLRSFPWIG